MQAIAGYTSATHKPIKLCTQFNTLIQSLNTYVDRYIQCVIHMNGIKQVIVREALKNGSLLGKSYKYLGGGSPKLPKCVSLTQCLHAVMCINCKILHMGANATIILPRCGKLL